MFLAFRTKLAALDSYVNPFNRRGALRLSRYHPSAYTGLTLFAAGMGYLFLGVFPLLALTMPVALYAAVQQVADSQGWVLIGVEALAAVIGALTTLSILSLRFTPPAGIELRDEHCPRLFELLRELGEAFADPRIDRVVLRDRFDVRIVKTPRHGFSFRTERTLVLGLPLLLALSPLDVHVLIARRVGQLSGKGSRLNNHLYYLRDIWTQYLSASERRAAWHSGLLNVFLRWYVPRYRALSLGAARRCELNADALSLLAINDRDAVRGITAQIMMDEYLVSTFWPQVVESARASMKQDKRPHAYMAEVFEAGLPHEQMRGLMKQVSTRRSNPNSTLPSLAERLANLAHREPLMPKPLAVSAARFFLGSLYAQCIEILDRRSSKKVRSEIIRQAGRSSQVA